MSQSTDEKELQYWSDEFWFLDIIQSISKSGRCFMARTCEGIGACDYLVEVGLLNREDILGGTVSRYTWNG